MLEDEIFVAVNGDRLVLAMLVSENDALVPLAVGVDVLCVASMPLSRVLLMATPWSWPITLGFEEAL